MVGIVLVCMYRCNFVEEWRRAERGEGGVLICWFYSYILVVLIPPPSLATRAGISPKSYSTREERNVSSVTVERLALVWASGELRKAHYDGGKV